MTLDSKRFLGWKRYNLFSSFSLILFFLFLFIFSKHNVLREIRFSSDYPINQEIIDELLGNSIHLINTDQIINKYLNDENIEKVSVVKIYPDTLEVKINMYETLALIIDYRTQSPIYYKLYKNGKKTELLLNEVTSLSNNINSIEIINGPLQENVYGEFVNYFMLLLDTDSSISTSFTLNSSNLVGVIGDVSIDFISPENLGKKASAVYQRLKEPCPSSSYIVDIDPSTGDVIVICKT